MQFITSLLFTVIFLVNCLPLGAQPLIQASVSEQTPVSIVAEWPIGPDTQVGEHFSARIIDNVVSDSGEIFIPKNSRVMGTIVDSQPAKSFHRRGKVDIQFERIFFPDNVTSLKIEADGTLIKESNKSELILSGIKQTTSGAVFGAIAGFKFAGILGSASSEGSSLAIGSMTGASIALISFIAQKGKEVEIFPGLPMILNINELEKQNYHAQEMKPSKQKQVNISVLELKDNRVKVDIQNNLNKPISLSNMKIIDGLGYTTQTDIGFQYHDLKSIPPQSFGTYEFKFTPTSKKGKYWIVLTDSFSKQEYFRRELQ